MLQKAPRAACRHIWSYPLPQGFALSLPQIHHSDFLLIHPPDKHHPHPQTEFIFVRSISWWFLKFSQPSRKLEISSPVKGKHHSWPGQAAGNSAPTPLCKTDPRLHLYYYIQLALPQPRGRGAWATLILLSQNWVPASRLPRAAQAANEYHLEKH